MPLFDFRCAKCDVTFEFTRPFGSKVIPACPECKSKKTEKLISPPAVHFKGGGWYKNDSKPVMKSAEKKESSETSGSGDSTKGTLRQSSEQAPGTEATKGVTKDANEKATKGTKATKETEAKGTEGKKESNNAA